MDFDKVNNLAEMAKTGDEMAVYQLTEEFKCFILARISRISIAGYHKTDLIQECNMAILKSLKYYNPDMKRFAKYGMNAVSNCIINLIRYNANHTAPDGKDPAVIDELIEETSADPKGSTEEITELNLLKKHLINAVKELPELDRKIIIHVYIKELPLKKFTVPDGTKMSYGVLRRRKEKALKQLKQALEPYRNDWKSYFVSR